MAQPPRPPPPKNANAPTQPAMVPAQAPAPFVPVSLPAASVDPVVVGGSFPAASVPMSAPMSSERIPSIPGMNALEQSLPGVNPADMKIDKNVGQVFGGKYKVERILGEGGMGIVYQARHVAIGKKFAIKLLHGDNTKDPEVVERFKVEAQAASSIGNEHIIDITDFAELPDGSTYFVMEFLDGRALTKLFEELTRVPMARLARIAKQLAQGLGAAHTAGIVHRDLKPDNIYLCKRSGGETDFVKILDFGIAKVGQGSNKLTKAGAIFGTPHYMSPEQASGSPIDHRTDIYALGVILYEGAVGRVPFDADNFMGILTQHMYKAPVPPRALPECPPDLPPGLEVIIMRCLRKKPEERYQTMEELCEDLERLLRGEVPKAAQDMMALSAGYQSLAQSALAAAGMPKPIPGEPPGSNTKQKSKWPLYAGIGGVAAVVLIAVIALMGPSKTNANETQKPEASDSAKPKVMTPVSASQTVSAAPTPSVAPKKSRVIMVTSTAPGAKIFEGDKELGDEPFNVDLEEGAKRTLTVKAAGYKDKTVTLDAKTPSKLAVPLTFAGGGGGVKKPGGGGEDDPWAKKP
ncbi:MAG: serine/threonine-protein kinase [Polyangiales bacterium]